MRYYLIAGEASGDLHGSFLLKGLKAGDPEAEFRFWGGALMSAAAGGQEPAVNYREDAVMGYGEVLKKAGALTRKLTFCKNDILHWKPDIVILIDYPGFNLRVARYCHKAGLRVFYYIAPKTWASREWRNRQLKSYVDKLFIVFPFEVPYFTRKGIPFIYKGNPLPEAIDAHVFERPSDEPYIAVLPGSRKGEISRMLPVCLEAVSGLGMKVLVAGAPSASESDYLPYIQGRDNVELLFDRTYDILKFAEAAVINSGTASLEAVLTGTPQLVCWSTDGFSYFIATRILGILRRIRYISLGNLCLNRGAFREFIQDKVTPEAIAEELRRLLNDRDYSESMKADYAAIREMLGGHGASSAIATAMIEELKHHAI
ncbi:MAG: lipid-A-disaccharide synthase [Bacteroidales bacterium]|nr:lipid-A-disaccharide synthase [Bacteroidales bacterium]